MITYGHITPFWNATDVYNLDYEKHPEPLTGFDPIDPADVDRYIIDVSVHRGLPSFLDQPQLHQEFAWLKDIGFAVSHMSPGEVLPWHQDRYGRYKKIIGAEESVDVVRCILFLEDRKPGHFIEIQGQSLLDWKAGDWLAWKYDCPHLACNLGSSQRYTLQITGMPLGH